MTLIVPFFAIGIGAGLASALMFASLLGGTFLALPLLALSPLPLVIASLGWGAGAGLIAGVAAVATLGLGLSWPAALSFLLAIAIPSLAASHLVGLARRPDPARAATSNADIDDTLAGDSAPDAGAIERLSPSGLRADRDAEWFPLGRVVIVTALLVAAVAILAGILSGYDVEATTRELSDTFAAMLREDGAGLDAAELEPLIRFTVRLLPVLFPATWTALILFSLWLGARIVALSGRLARPREDLTGLDLPAWSGAALIGAGVAALLPAPAGLVAAPFFGGLLVAHAVIGLAVLHRTTRGQPMRPAILGFVYAIVLLFTVPALLLALLGLVERVVKLRARRFPPAQT